MEVFEAVRTLLAVREYQPTLVPEASLRRILEAGRLTGSARNRQPWHFIVVQAPEMLRRLGGLLPSGPYVAQAPLAIVVAITPTPSAVGDASRAIQSMLLTAWQEGLGSNWVSGAASLKPMLDLPAAVEVLAVLPLGYPKRAVGQGRKQRKALAEIAHRERWGQRFE